MIPSLCALHFSKEQEYMKQSTLQETKRKSFFASPDPLRQKEDDGPADESAERKQRNCKHSTTGSKSKLYQSDFCPLCGKMLRIVVDKDDEDEDDNEESFNERKRASMSVVSRRTSRT